MEAALGAAFARRRGDPQVGPGRDRHADVADRGREHRPDDEEQRSAELDREAAVVDRQDQQQDEDDDREDGQGLELPVQVGRRAFLHRLGDLLHLRRALIGGQDLLGQDEGEDEGRDGDHGDDGDEASLAPADPRCSDYQMRPDHADSLVSAFARKR